MKPNRLAILGLALVAGFILSVVVPAPAQTDAPKRVLVVTVTKGFRHSSIPTAEKIIADLGKTSGAFAVDYARVEPNDPQFKGGDGKPDTNKVNAAIVKVLSEKMSPAALKNYDAIVFANTTGVLPLPDKQAFLDAIAGGKGFVGMHSASDTFHGSKDLVDPYITMLGGEFLTHGKQVGVECRVCDATFPATKHLGATLPIRQEEIYLLKNYDPAKVHELLVLDKHPNEGKAGHYPVSWCREFGKGRVLTPPNGATLLIMKSWRTRPGRVFYTSLGHREDIWDTDPAIKDRINAVEVSEAYQKHILGGILWALGLQPGDATPQNKSQAE